MRYGYARVSTQEQETHAQTDALSRAGCDQIFTEKRSGVNMRRPILESVLVGLKPGDVVISYKIDRIARSLRDLINIIDRIQECGASFHSLTESIDTSTPAGRMILHILGAFAEFELSMIRERTIAGMKAAAERGATFGAPKALNPTQEAEAIRLWQTHRWTKAALAHRYSTSVSSIKRMIQRAGMPQDRFTGKRYSDKFKASPPDAVACPRRAARMTISAQSRPALR